ncbi:hypothetical protein J8273_4544 [Carpediemonas membranifera]|uniref:Leucine zipper transcription factor-like protein 1 n=1 Tax=Carpediemonas membranifera TaxID=201153 RepID=A0A8J6B691_9EUKA|nr:hypothetical protein J8273_4544 [Carpediemonas membranifera]|eukprot:KAG9393944.1 hypothetical protein J8273_4544 [Carpediemonas membranifera]
MNQSVHDGLDAHDEAQMNTYSQFASVRRKRTKKEIDATFQAFTSDEITEDFYSRDDCIDTLIPALKEQVQSNLEAEQDALWRSIGVLLKNLLTQASAHGNPLEIDVTRLEDMKDMQTIQLNGTASLAPLRSTLPSLGRPDTKVYDRINVLQDENARLKKELQGVSAENTEGAADRQSMADMLKNSEAEVQALKKEMDKRLQEQKQFQLLQQMLKKKSETIKELQAKLDAVQL